MTTTERVLNILVNEGHYRLLDNPVKVGSQQFDFTHTLVASGKGNDIVTVIELTGATSNAAVTRLVLSFARALDVLRSRRSITAVLTSGQADKDLVNSINRVCRVLAIGAPSGDDAKAILRDRLAVLLPLMNPRPVEHLGDWRSGVEQTLQAELSRPLVSQFIENALAGEEAVQSTLAHTITTLADDALNKDEA